MTQLQKDQLAKKIKEEMVGKSAQRANHEDIKTLHYR